MVVGSFSGPECPFRAEHAECAQLLCSRSGDPGRTQQIATNLIWPSSNTRWFCRRGTKIVRTIPAGLLSMHGSRRSLFERIDCARKREDYGLARKFTPVWL